MIVRVNAYPFACGSAATLGDVMSLIAKAYPGQRAVSVIANGWERMPTHAPETWADIPCALITDLWVEVE